MDAATLWLLSRSTAYPPSYEWGYDQITSAVSVTSTTESSGTTVITAAAHTFDGAPVVAEFFCPYATVTGSGQTLTVSLFESSTQICRLAEAQVITTPSGAGSNGGPINYPTLARYRFTPTAGAHTYTVTAFSSASSGASVGAGGAGTGGYAPAYLRFTKV